MPNTSERKLVAIAFCLLFVVACSSEPGRLTSPTSPSTPTLSPPPASLGDATISGLVNPASSVARSGVAAATSRITVTVVGTALSAETDAGGRFALQGVPAGDVRLQFSGAGVNAELGIPNVQRREQIEIVVIANGSTATLESSSRRGPDNKVELEGLISTINAADRTLQVAASLVSVPTGTVIRHGSRMFDFSDLRVNDRVHIRGTPGSSMIEAQEIQLQNSSGPGPAGNEVELEGAVQALSGTCPDLSFTVNGTAVTTNALTEFEDPCTAIANGVEVEVEGTLQNGTLVAREVQLRELDIRGLLQGLSGSCPTISFTVNGTAVTTNGLTDFRDGGCGAIANGAEVRVRGPLLNGILVARRVDILAPAVAEVELEGTVQSLSGTCPSLSFTVNGTAVTTNALTEFEEGPCTAIANGTQVEVKGTPQNGTVLAREVEILAPEIVAEVEVEGIVQGLSGTCPNLSFTVNGTAVTTNALTEFEDPCTAITNGVEVEVEGALQNGTLVAREVQLRELDIRGLLQGLSGSCPTISFTVNGTAVTTNGLTDFREAPCSALASGAEVRVRGPLIGGVLIARRVELREAAPAEVELRGTVAALGGSCPNLSFTVNGTGVTTNGLTEFKDGPCSALANGVPVRVRGLFQGGSVVASRVENRTGKD